MYGTRLHHLFHFHVCLEIFTINKSNIMSEDVVSEVVLYLYVQQMINS